MEAAAERFQNDVIEEHRVAVAGLGRLEVFVTGPIFPILDPAVQTLLLEQASVMPLYVDVLRRRIARF